MADYLLKLSSQKRIIYELKKIVQEFLLRREAKKN